MARGLLDQWRPQRELTVPVYLQIESWIEGLIFNRALKAHAPLPAVSEMAQQWNISALTAHKAYRRLKQRGLVYAIVGNGTFVSPVEHNRFVGVLIHRDTLAMAVESPTVLLYLNAIHRELAANGYRDRLIVDNTHRVPGERKPISADAMNALDDPSLHALIAVAHDGSDEALEILRRRKLPSIGFGVDFDDYDVSVKSGQNDYGSAALRRLAEYELVDVALFYFDDPQKADEHRVGYLQKTSTMFAAHGITMHPEWVIAVSDMGMTGGQQAFEHLWSGGQRPRGLILMDDVIARSVLAGMMARHVRVPDDLRVCVLCNAHSPLVFPRSWIRWEYDTQGICRDMVETINKLERGESVPRRIQMVPREKTIDEGKTSTERGPRGLGGAGFRTARQILSLAKA